MNKKMIISELQLNNAFQKRTIDRLAEKVKYQAMEMKGMEEELDSLRLVDLDTSLSEEELDVYEDGMRALNKEGKMTEEDIAFLYSLPAIPITRQEVREIVLSVMVEIAVEAQRE